MKNCWLFILCLVVCNISYAQTTVEFERLEEVVEETQQADYEYNNKDRKYSKEREFTTDPKSKYTDANFQYIEDDPAKEFQPEKKEQEPSSRSRSFDIFGLNFGVFLLVVLGVLALIAILFNFDFSYFTMKKYKQKVADTLTSEEEEDIDEGDYERLLERAISQQNFRLATRYYYVWLLQKLSQKNYIEYHKEKTNSDYLFELKDKEVRSKFSYLSYIYSYVWYGEFPVDEFKFTTIKEKYQSFMNQIK